MKQYTTPDQTAKLIELGFESPKIYVRFSPDGGYWADYTLGELIEMLPPIIEHTIWWGEEKDTKGIWGLCIDTSETSYGWDVWYKRDYSAPLYRVGRSELIDALYAMIVKLKEEGVI